jgi:hypothetical protein
LLGAVAQLYVRISDAELILLTVEETVENLIVVHSLPHQPFNAGIKSLHATLPDEIFTGDFSS